MNTSNPERSEVKMTPTKNKVQPVNPVILDALDFRPEEASDQEVRAYASHLQILLEKTVNLLEEKDRLCENLERQNTSLLLQKNSLRDIVHVIKGLIGTQISEVAYMHEQIDTMKGRIILEGERQEENQQKLAADLPPSDDQDKALKKEDKKHNDLQIQVPDLQLPLDKGIGDTTQP